RSSRDALMNDMLASVSGSAILSGDKPAPPPKINLRPNVRNGMEIRYEPPPIYDRICQAFPLAKDNPYVVFTFGDVLFVPNRAARLDDALIEHEKVHAMQQVAGPGAWWDRYIVDLTFRFEQELQAHRAEYLTRVQRQSKGFKAKRGRDGRAPLQVAYLMDVAG